MPDQIVIIDETGGHHVFPAGFDPQRAAAIVRQQRQPQIETKPWSSRLGLSPARDTSGIAFGLDTAQGFTSELVKRGFQGGDLIRRALGMERVKDTPEAQAAMTAPPGLAGTIGRTIEQGLEFAAPLSAISKAAAGLSIQ